MSLIDNVLNRLPYSNVLNNSNQEELNNKFDLFSKASVTKDEKIQRLSILNKFDMSMVGTQAAGMMIHSLNELIFSSDANDKAKRIESYRMMSGFPEVTECLREICDEFLVKDENGKIIQFALRGNNSEDSKEQIKDEFYRFLEIFEIENKGWDLIRDFLIEGEVFFENIVSVQRPELGIVGLTRAGTDRIDPFYYDIDNELIQFYVLRKKVLDNASRNNKYSMVSAGNMDKKNEILFLNEKQITYIHSGVWDDSGKKKYRKPHIENGSRSYRQLALIEDASIIYMLVRAPERLVFNIDTGHLPPAHAEAYVKKQMAEFWNRKGIGRDQRVENVYDPMTMLENYYFAKPRDGDGSTVTSIGGGKASPDNIEFLTMFINRLCKSLSVPLQRLNSESGVSDGMDITREELKFAKFIIRLQQRFAEAIKSTFITHLKLKGRTIRERSEQYGLTLSKENKEWFDFTDWNNYDQLISEIKRLDNEKISEIKEIQGYHKTIMKETREELDRMSSLIMEDSTRSEKVQLLTERYNDSYGKIQELNVEINTIQEWGESLWEQYGLREEDIDLEFNKPSQYFALREQQMWQLKFESYQSLAGDDLISTTMAQKTFLGWSDSEIMQNREALRKDAALRWELSNIETEGPDFRERMAEAMGGGMGGGMEGDPLGGDFGDGLGGDMDTDLPDFGDAPSDDELAGIAGDDAIDSGPSEDDLPPPE